MSGYYNHNNSNEEDVVWDGMSIIIISVLVGSIGFVLSSSPLLRNRLISNWERWKLNRLVQRYFSSSNTTDLKISAIYIYPVKSCRGVSVDSAKLDSLGLVGDRRLMLVQPRPLPLSGSFTANEATHGFVTQRQCPSLATIVASLPTSNNDSIVLSSNTKSISVDVSIRSLLSKERTRYRASIWGDIVDVVDMGDEVANFILQSITNTTQTTQDNNPFKDIRLVSMIPSVTQRMADSNFVPKSAYDTKNGKLPMVSLADGFPLLLTSEQSLSELNRRLIAKGKETLPMSRFRPNIVVSSSSSSILPFEEDEWKILSVTPKNNNKQQLLLHVVKGCPRCKQSCVDQITGNATDTEPLETMADFRKKHSGDVFFGQNVILAETNGQSIIHVGDTVHIIQRGTPVWG